MAKPRGLPSPRGVIAVERLGATIDTATTGEQRELVTQLLRVLLATACRTGSALDRQNQLRDLAAVPS